jgi:DNA-binding transcriptional ArsR family regulator
MPDARSDRLEALRAAGPDGIATLFAKVPVLAETVSGIGPLSRFDFRGYSRPAAKPIADATELAEYLSSAMAIDLCLQSLDVIESQCLVTLVWMGGHATLAELARFSGGIHTDRARVAVDGLCDRLLAHRRHGMVTVRPGVPQQVSMPGRALANSLEWIGSDEIARRLRALGVFVPKKKAERMDALLEAVRDRTVVERALSAVSDEARVIFERLFRYHTATLDVVGLSYFMPYSHHQRNQPFYELYDLGLVDVERDGRRCWIWLDVRVALHGGLYPTWPEAPDPAPVPIGVGDTGIPPAVRLLERVMETWKSKTVVALKSGGIGVSVMRAAAKQHGVSAGEVGLVVTLAIELELLEPTVLSRSGKGRNQAITRGWVVTPRWDTFRAHPTAERWRVLVQTWRDSLRLPGGDALPERFEYGGLTVRPMQQRDVLLRVLSALPPSTGLPLEGLTALLCFRHGASITPAEVAPVVTAARALSLVPATGPIGLTTAAARMLRGGSAAAAADGAGSADGSRQFVVQADHSVIVPPDLDHDIEERLDTMAALESSGGARIYRITERSIIGALDGGSDVDTIIDFLREHSSVPVAPNVVRTITDAAGRHGKLLVGTASSWVTSDDPVALTSAVAVKAAKLTMLNVTTAFSPLSEAELVAALRGKGLAPLSEAEETARMAREFRVADARENGEVSGTGGGAGGPGPFVVRTALLMTSEEMMANAQRIAEGKPAPSKAGQRAAKTWGNTHLDAMAAGRDGLPRSFAGAPAEVQAMLADLLAEADSFLDDGDDGDDDWGDDDDDLGEGWGADPRGRR